uniref:Uncharacterized protein n=1 Tax=Sphaerodactylus townsendi TaxID=933632 RepID=A0ACB8ESH5_9SAUR
MQFGHWRQTAAQGQIRDSFGCYQLTWSEPRQDISSDWSQGGLRQQQVVTLLGGYKLPDPGGGAGVDNSSHFSSLGAAALRLPTDYRQAYASPMLVLAFTVNPVHKWVDYGGKSPLVWLAGLPWQGMVMLGLDPEGFRPLGLELASSHSSLACALQISSSGASNLWRNPL